MEFKLLKQLTEIPAPSGSEYVIAEFLLKYIKKESKNWVIKPTIYSGDGFADTIVLSFGKPKAAIFMHTDTVGYSVGYDNNLIDIGGPAAKKGALLVGEDSKGKIVGELEQKEDEYQYVSNHIQFKRKIDRGTTLTYYPLFKETKTSIQSCYLDNRLGVFKALELAKTIKNGVICFSTKEEHGGGSVGFLSRFIYETLGVSKAIIADITWVTEGIHHDKGTVISIRDSGIPRRKFVNEVIEITKKHKVKHQLEVESAGGSDGQHIMRSPYPIDWIFIGTPIKDTHTPHEFVYKSDIKNSIKLYQVLMEKL